MAVKLSETVFNRYMELPQGSRVQAEYIWIGGSGRASSSSSGS